MRQSSKLILAVVVVLLLVLAYWAVVGFPEPVPDFQGGFTGSTNPIGGPDEPTAVALFTVDTSFYGWTLYSGTPFSKMNGLVKSFNVEVVDWQGSDTARVYERNKLDLLAHHPPPGTVVGEFWINVTVSGPSGFFAWWESKMSPLLDTNDGSNPSFVTWDTGRCLIVVKGSYAAVVTLKGVLSTNGWSGDMVTRLLSFDVNV